MSEQAVGKLNAQSSATPLSSDLSLSPISHVEQPPASSGLLLTQFAWVSPLLLGLSEEVPADKAEYYDVEGRIIPARRNAGVSPRSRTNEKAHVRIGNHSTSRE
jgi:hypothetical protein